MASFGDIEPEFRRRIERIVWCTATTVDGRGRPRSRILHPIWEGATGWIATGRQSAKARHLARTPYVSLTYWDPAHEQIHAECRAVWTEAPAEKRRVWDLFKSTPPPLGYDPGLFFPGPDDASFGLLKLTPWLVELWSLADLVAQRSPTVWRA